MAAVSVVPGTPPAFGLGPKGEVPLALTLPASVMTLGTGRATVPQGVVHPVILAALLPLVVVP